MSKSSKAPVKNFKIPIDIWEEDEIKDVRKDLGPLLIPVLLSIWKKLAAVNDWELRIDKALMNVIAEDSGVTLSDVDRFLKYFFKKRRKLTLVNFRNKGNLYFLWSRLLEDKLLNDVLYHRKYSKSKYKVKKSKNGVQGYRD